MGVSAGPYEDEGYQGGLEETWPKTSLSTLFKRIDGLIYVIDIRNGLSTSDMGDEVRLEAAS